MLHFTPNILRNADANGVLERIGRSLWYLKDTAVQAGYTVRGSGDGGTRFAWNGVTAALSTQQQGSGGAYDCWRTGDIIYDASLGIAGDANNANAWVCLEAPSGRQVLLCNTNQTGTGWAGYGRVAILRVGLGGFDGTTAAAATIPALVAGEYWFLGSRAAASGVSIVSGTAGGRYHYWADTHPGAGGDPLFGYVFTLDSNNAYGILVFSPVETSLLPGDSDPCIYMTSVGSTSENVRGYDPVSDTWPAAQTLGWGGMWTATTGGGLQQADDRTNTALLRWPLALNVTNTHPFKGVLHRSAPRWCSAAKGTVLFSSSGQTWMSLGAIAVPWPMGVRPRM